MPNVAARTADVHVAWSGGSDANPHSDGHRGQALTLDLELPEGSHHDFVLVLSEQDLTEPPPDAERAWRAAETQWAARVPELGDTIAPRDARHAYAVLSGLTSATGAMVAAATTSLPERARQGRNYDYRYAWVRDQCYSGQAVAAAGAHPSWMTPCVSSATVCTPTGPTLRPPTRSPASAVPDQRTLELSGYPGGTD